MTLSTGAPLAAFTDDAAHVAAAGTKVEEAALTGVVVDAEYAEVAQWATTVGTVQAAGVIPASAVSVRALLVGCTTGAAHAVAVGTTTASATPAAAALAVSRAEAQQVAPVGMAQVGVMMAGPGARLPGPELNRESSLLGAAADATAGLAGLALQGSAAKLTSARLEAEDAIRGSGGNQGSHICHA